MIADIYAVGCLIVWFVPLGCVAAMLFMKKQEEDRTKLASISLSVSLFVSILLAMNLSSDNPNYLCVVLAVLVLLLATAGSRSRRFHMQSRATLFALIGTLVLFFFFFHVLQAGYHFRDLRFRARMIGLSSTLKHAARNDQSIYPAGKFDENHPAFAANPDLKQPWQYAGTRRDCWHTCFTGLWYLTPLLPPELPAGTLTDNLELLQEYIQKNTKVRFIVSAGNGGKP